ncbi:hypothetical protein H6A23_08655 [Olsenella uli]|uniref:hypothetical protein n=1 Tax=Olsenella uli TaxID=133926 RepID=UPI00195CC70D|nr:hypothetical protein [Olsenella uli]MBM6817227.1 hypothetical protein [Olsenella uli]
MTNDNELDELSDAPQQPSEQEARTPYVRQRPAHRSVEPIDDFANEEDEPAQIAHDSGYTIGGGAFSGRGYRRSRADSQQLRRDLHYGQYLEIPKGRRDIFVSRERKTRIKTALALIAVLAVLAVVVYFLWGYMQTNWGATS